MGRALWIAERCRAFGLKVVEVDGWQSRGRDTFNPRGVVCHHTAGGSGEMPSLRVLVNGRSDLPGPLCNVGLGRSGTVYVVASGTANHAGRGGWRGLSGNSSVLGIEAENRGGAGDPWPSVQHQAYVKLAAALITGPGVGGDIARVCGHKEWAPGRKPDPHSIDMDAFRASVKRYLTDGEPEEDDMALFKDRDDFKGALREVLDEKSDSATPHGLRWHIRKSWKALYKSDDNDPSGYAEHLNIVTAAQERDRALLVEIAKAVGVTVPDENP